MVRRSARELTGLRTRAPRYRAVVRAEKIDCTSSDAVLEANQLKTPSNIRRAAGTDPGPAGFDWVEIASAEIKRRGVIWVSRPRSLKLGRSR